MSKIDNLLKSLGYNVACENRELIMFVKLTDNGNLEICFYKERKTIGIYADTGETIFGNTICDSVELTYQEIKAINLKCKELGFEKE